MRPDIQLREVLACEILHEDRILVVFIERQGMQFKPLGYLMDDQAALVRHPPTLKLLEWVFDLPVRLLDGDEAAFLGVQTTRADREGRDYYHLRVPKLPLR